MTPRAAALIAVGTFAGFALLHRQADQAAAVSAASDEGDGATALDYFDPWGAIERQHDQYVTEQAMNDPDKNVRAFLALIAWAEGTERAADPYRVCYAYKHTIKSFADHPAVTGEWRGERLPDVMCAGAGLGPGCVSTAAGRYQIIKPSWLEGKRALGLRDFSPESQDRWAVWKIGKRGALDAVRDGRIEHAIDLCRAEWASLPGAGYGQPERKLAQLLDAYTDAGGVVVA